MQASPTRSWSPAASDEFWYDDSDDDEQQQQQPQPRAYLLPLYIRRPHAL